MVESAPASNRAQIDSLTHPDLPVPRIGAAIRTLRRAWPGIFARLYPEAAAMDIGVGLADALLILTLRHSDGATMSELAESMRVDASTATRAVDRLVEKGLAARVRSESDGRVAVVRPTLEGLALEGRLVTRAGATYQAVLARQFSEAELLEVADMIERLVAAFESDDWPEI